MLGNAMGIDLGQILTTASALKSAALHRDIAQQQLEWAKQDRLFQQEQFQKTQQVIKQKIANKELPSWMAGLGLDNISRILTIQSFMDKKKQQKWIEHNNTYLAAIWTVMNSQEKEKTWQKLRNKLPDEIKKIVPEHYDPDFAKFAFYQLAGVNKLIQEDYLSRLGLSRQIKIENIRHRNTLTEKAIGHKYRLEEQQNAFNLKMKAAQQSAQKSGVKASDVRLIQSIIQKSILGYGQIGAMEQLLPDKEQQEKIVKAVKIAADLLRKGQATDAADAAYKALKIVESENKTTTQQKVNPKDPLGLFKK